MTTVWEKYLKAIGAIPKSTEFRVGDQVIATIDGQEEQVTIIGVLPTSNSLKVKVVDSKDRVHYISPEDVRPQNS